MQGSLQGAVEEIPDLIIVCAETQQVLTHRWKDYFFWKGLFLLKRIMSFKKEILRVEIKKKIISIKKGNSRSRNYYSCIFKVITLLYFYLYFQDCIWILQPSAPWSVFWTWAYWPAHFILAKLFKGNLFSLKHSNDMVSSWKKILNIIKSLLSTPQSSVDRLILAFLGTNQNDLSNEEVIK